MEDKAKIIDGWIGFVFVLVVIGVLVILVLAFAGVFSRRTCPAGDATVGAATAERCASDCVNEGKVETNGRKHVCDHPGITPEIRLSEGCDNPAWLDEKAYIPLYLPGNVNQQPQCLCRDPNMDYQPIW